MKYESLYDLREKKGWNSFTDEIIEGLNKARGFELDQLDEDEQEAYRTLIFGTLSSIITNEIYGRRLNQ